MYKVIIILLILVFFSANICPQENDPIEDLYKYDPWVVTLALEVIQRDKLEEAVPIIVGLIEEKQPFIQLKFLETLLFFDYSEIVDISIDLISRADAFADSIPPFDPLEAKAIATGVLFTQENYSTVDYVFELFDRDKPQVNQTALYLLPIIAQSIPNYSLQAKNELLYAFENNVDTEYRSLAISFLVSLDGSEMLDVVVEMLNTSSKLSDKRQAYNLINRINDASLNSFLKDRLSIEQEWTLRILISDSLLIKFGEPSDLKAVIDYLPFETHSTVSYSISAEIENFIPQNQ